MSFPANFDVQLPLFCRRNVIWRLCIWYILQVEEHALTAMHWSREYINQNGGKLVCGKECASMGWTLLACNEARSKPIKNSGKLASDKELALMGWNIAKCCNVTVRNMVKTVKDHATAKTRLQWTANILRLRLNLLILYWLFWPFCILCARL